LVDAPARGLVLRSSDGELTILDGHTTLVTDVVPGLVRVDVAEGDPVRMAVHSGYLQVESNLPGEGNAKFTRVTMLAGVAELAGDIDVPRAQAAKAKAEAAIETLKGGARLADSPSDGQLSQSGELLEAEGALRRATVRLEVAGATNEAVPAFALVGR
jgi:F-type H+-transporting ATPase subunit epsilon